MALTNAQIQKAYIAFFNRPADASGLAWWRNYPGSVEYLLNTFSTTPEYLAEYAGKTPAQTVDAVYVNLFGRHAEVGGLAFWAGHLAAGNLTGNIAITILNSAGVGDKDVIDNKTEAAIDFTNYLASHADAKAAYETGAASVVKIAKDWLSDIGASSTSKDSAISGIGNAANNLINVAAGGGIDPDAGYNVIRATSDSGGSLWGTDGNDKIYGGVGRDSIYGRSGDDWLEGGDGNDNLHGDAGNDILYGGDGNDTLSGDAGHDILNGGAGDDSLYGDSGNDTLNGGEGNNYLYGGSGDDTYRFDPQDSEDIIKDESGNDTFLVGLNSYEAMNITLGRYGTWLIITLPASAGRNITTIMDFYSLGSLLTATAGKGSGVIETLKTSDQQLSVNLWEVAKSLPMASAVTGPATKLSELINAPQLSVLSHDIPALKDARGADDSIYLVGVAPDTLTDGGNAVPESFL
ncbi:hypothetical protein AGMMS50256_25320 [Betaproteobacteria bacterium]|nr:hypothetical protein AGMMS50256_25320 [Betaproteobacteria bacterium]